MVPLFLSLLLFLSVASGFFFAWEIGAPLYYQYRARSVAQTLSSLDEQFLFLTHRQADSLYSFSMIVTALAGGFLFSNLAWPWYLLALAVSALAGYPVPRWGIAYFSKKRLEKIEKQIPDFLKMMAGSLRAGLSLSDSINLCVKELPSPISQELGLVLKKIKMGKSLEEGLRFFDNRLNLEEVRLVVSAIILSNEAGGSISHLFDKLENTLTERKRIKGKIDALTSQGKIQGWVVGLLPLFLGLVLYLIDPALITPFWTTAAGGAGLIAIALLELAGYWMIRKIVSDGEV
ncbi:MAG: type II secretion system F family protein [Nitrospirae bacterium]|nr:type II secretion system F family protein [Nitrospirota bacterium]